MILWYVITHLCPYSTMVYLEISWNKFLWEGKHAVSQSNLLGPVLWPGWYIHTILWYVITIHAHIQKWFKSDGTAMMLTHWGRVTHICVSKLTIIGSDNGLSPGWRQAIIWTSAGILLIGSLGTNVSEVLIGIKTFLFKKMQLKISSAKWRLFCLGLNVLIGQSTEPVSGHGWLTAFIQYFGK